MFRTAVTVGGRIPADGEKVNTTTTEKE